MQAQAKRHISSGYPYDALFPQSIHKDAVVVGSGNARLKDTLNLMQQMIPETCSDTKVLAKKLKGHHVSDTCRNIWNFVYGHIQYKMDKTGIEQVRRPSRTWADRTTGVDCDCYTVFIGSILHNLAIPYKIRITKYGGKKHFQHVYPIVPQPSGHITIDCVADHFNYEVPYSEKRDITPNEASFMDNISGLSGVDMADITLNALVQPKIPLHQISRPAVPRLKENHERKVVKPKYGETLSPFRWSTASAITTKPQKKERDFDVVKLVIISGISVMAGIGILKLLSRKSKQGNRKKATPKTI